MSLKETLESFLAENSSELESAFFHEEIDCGYSDNDELGDELRNANIAFDCVEQHGGEGEGEDFYTVYKFTKGDETIFVKFQGWYQSYNGSEMTEYKIVTPKTVEVVIYE